MPSKAFLVSGIVKQAINKNNQHAWAYFVTRQLLKCHCAVCKFSILLNELNNYNDNREFQNMTS